MKKLLTYSLSLLLLAAWCQASAQDRPITPDSKNQPASSTKGADKKTDTVPVKTDAQNRSYILVDGRKVWVDKQEEQNFINPRDSAYINRKVKNTK